MTSIFRRIRKAIVKKQYVPYRDPRYNNVYRNKKITVPNFQTAAGVAAASIFTQLGLDHLVPNQAPRGAKSSIASRSDVKRKFTGDRIGAAPKRQKNLSTPFMAPTATPASTKSSAAASSRSFANSSRVRTMPMLGKRKRGKRYKRPLPRSVRPKHMATTTSSRQAKGSTSRGRITVVNKLMTGITPTDKPGGCTLTDKITVIGSETTPNGGFGLGWNFKLTDFPNYADYTDVYQWYKILFVKIHFYPLNNTYPGFQTTSAGIPALTAAGGTNYRSCEAPQVVYAKDDQSSAEFTTEVVAMQHAGASLYQIK